MANNDVLLLNKIKKNEPFKDFISRYGNEGLKAVLSYIFILGYERAERIFYTTPFSKTESLLKSKQAKKNLLFLKFYIKNKAYVKAAGVFQELSVYLKSLKEAGFQQKEIFLLFLSKYGDFNAEITKTDLSFFRKNIKQKSFEDSLVFSLFFYSYLLNEKNDNLEIADAIIEKSLYFQDLSDFNNALSKQNFFYRDINVHFGENEKLRFFFAEKPSLIFSVKSLSDAVKKLETLKNPGLVSPFILNILFPSIIKIFNIQTRMEKEEQIEEVMEIFIKAADYTDLKHLVQYLNKSYTYSLFFEKDSFLFLLMAETLFSKTVLNVFAKRKKIFNSFLSSFEILMFSEIKKFCNLKTEITFFKTEYEYEKIYHIINNLRFADIPNIPDETKEHLYMLKRISFKMENVLKKTGFDFLYNVVKNEGSLTQKESIQFFKILGLNPLKKISADKKRILAITPYLKHNELSIDDAVPVLKGFLKKPEEEYETADFKEEEIFLINLRKSNALTLKALEVLKKDVGKKIVEKKFPDI